MYTLAPHEPKTKTLPKTSIARSAPQSQASHAVPDRGHINPARNLIAHSTPPPSPQKGEKRLQRKRKRKKGIARFHKGYLAASGTSRKPHLRRFHSLAGMYTKAGKHQPKRRNPRPSSPQPRGRDRREDGWLSPGNTTPSFLFLNPLLAHMNNNAWLCATGREEPPPPPDRLACFAPPRALCCRSFPADCPSNRTAVLPLCVNE